MLALIAAAVAAVVVTALVTRLDRDDGPSFRMVSVSGFEIVVFLCVEGAPWARCDQGDPVLGGRGATEDDRTAIERELAAMPQVAAMWFIDRQRAYREFAGDSPELAHTAVPESMAESFALRLRPGTDRNAVIVKARSLRGVAEVISG
ncbi:hypothetical protein HerbRD11066_37060 [Herbidospora sp. RD11066]